MTATWAAHLPAGTRPDQVDLLAAVNLPRAWARHWAEAPDHPTLTDDDDGWISAGELEERTRRMAGRFAASGLVAGDRILLSAAASVPLVVAHVAALRLGLVVVPANTGYRARELAHLVRDAAPAAALVDDRERAGWLAAAAESAGIALTVLRPDVDLPDGPDPVLDGARSDDPAIIAYTSGTTGAPKGAVLSHANLLASAEALALAWRWTPEDRLILALPLFHLHGLGVGLHGTLVAGASVVLRQAFSVEDVLDHVGREPASLFFGVPTMWSRLAASARAEELRGLRLGVSGSAPLPADLHGAIETASGQRVIERYGMTETVMNVSNPYDGERRPGTVGLPLPGVEVRLDEGTNEIRLRGPNVFAGYLDRPEATAEAFDAGGWFASGDVGAFDPDGYLRIVGRRKELIITGGYNVYPREVEDVLRTHPGIADAAVVGAPHPDWGEEVVAVVEAGDQLDTAAVLAHAATQLAGYKRPRRVVVVPALPRNALGKVVKADLAPLVR